MSCSIELVGKLGARPWGSVVRQINSFFSFCPPLPSVRGGRKGKNRRGIKIAWQRELTYVILGPSPDREKIENRTAHSSLTKRTKGLLIAILTGRSIDMPELPANWGLVPAAPCGNKNDLTPVIRSLGLRFVGALAVRVRLFYFASRTKVLSGSGR
jgi:hypothetical protein